MFDALRTPDPARLDVRRRAHPRVGLGLDVVRTLRVDAGSTPRAAGLWFEADEEFPRSFEVRARTWLADERGGLANLADAPRSGTSPSAAPRSAVQRSLAPQSVAPRAGDPSGGPDGAHLSSAGPVDLVRTYRAHLRGVHALGRLRLRLRGRLGLVVRTALVHGAQPIEVEPALLTLRRNLKLAASERWRDLGVRTLRRRGGMLEFESLRELVTGDDVRSVDWKASARRARPIVRQYQEERGQEIVIAIDCGRRMGSTTSHEIVAQRGVRVRAGTTKLDHALDAALQLCAIALQHGDRVGVLAFDDGVRAWIPARRNAAHQRRLRDALFALEPSERESDLERALRELALRHPRRALVLVLSDVADPLSLDRQRRALATASRRHRLVLAALDDPAPRVASAPESQAPAALRAVALAAEAERRAALRSLASARVRTLDAVPSELAGPLVATWLSERRAL